MAKTKDWMSKIAAADLVFDAIITAGQNEYVTIAWLAKHTGMKESQVRNGLAHIKDVLSGEETQPLVFDYDVGYRFADSRAMSEEYERARLRVLQKQLARLITGTCEPAQTKFRSTAMRRVNKLIVRLEEDVREVIEELG